MVGRCQSVIAELNVGRIATELLNYGKGIAIRYRLRLQVREIQNIEIHYDHDELHFLIKPGHNGYCAALQESDEAQGSSAVYSEQTLGLTVLSIALIQVHA